MKIPLKYNLRSLWVRKIGTLMTAFGIGLTVAIVIVMLALTHGLESTFIETGQDHHLVVIRQGSQNEVNSFFDRDIFETIRSLDGIARDGSGQILAAGEISVIINHPRLTGEAANVLVRGTSEAGFVLRPEVRIVEGRKFQRGAREIVVSKSLGARFQDMTLGSVLPIGPGSWTVVGVFDAGNSAYGSEIWADYSEIAQEWERPIYSSVLLKAEGGQAAEEIVRRVEEDRRIQLQAIDQKEYFRQQTVSSIGIKALGVFIAVVMGIGSSFAAMNMMYAAVLSRFKEVGTLRALGFRRRSIMASFLVESLLLALAGGVIGCLIALPIHGYSTGTANFMTFSEVLFNFRITPTIMIQGLAFAGIVGLLGGFLPARRAARVKLIDVMRD
jgi:putative ABC transport system permease protein